MSSTSTRLSPSTTPIEAPAAEPVLVTEHEVAVATAAARAGRPTKKQKPVLRRHPKRHAFLERALMAREMDRL
ncbi:hypothetical protein H7I53_25045 [Mycolicibacterium pulveris]|uniref:Uncharacterized protein n=1 Tax=Mycolicibacterium pulveris TaxID=36813 RepID=A0A7I7UPN1_MYCPV|nr:hypothetical protein [Mycolicibacterium pulveris]MCV6983471.1 hypothetical protein [Mycolicibacterium pulveris]BBY83348.1 hypothetical protein MPUL_45060 [Mycolicibacterium pulveris]